MMAGLVCVVATSAFSLATPWVIRYGIDSLSEEITGDRLLLYSGLIVGLAAFQGISRFLMRWLMIGVSRRIRVPPAERRVRAHGEARTLVLSEKFYRGPHVAGDERFEQCAYVARSRNHVHGEYGPHHDDCHWIDVEYRLEVDARGVASSAADFLRCAPIRLAHPCPERGITAAPGQPECPSTGKLVRDSCREGLRTGGTREGRVRRFKTIACRTRTWI